MKEGLRAAHRLFVVAAASAVLGLLVCFPRLEDGRRLQALRTLEALAAEFDPATFEAERLREAEGSAAPSLAELVKEVEGPGVKGLSAGSAAPELFRAAPLSLSTLGDVVGQSRPGTVVSVAGPDIQGMVVGLRWRIGRLGSAADTTLTGLRLGEGSANGHQLTTEANVESKRLEAIEERKAFVKARKRFHHYRDRAKRLKKQGASRTLQRKSAGKRREVFDEMSAAQLVLEGARTRYQTIADQAATFLPGESAGAPGLVVIATVLRAGEARTELRIPVPKVKYQAKLEPAALPDGLKELSDGPLWPTLQHTTAEAALPPMRAGLSWHLWGRDIGPLRVGGATVLQLFPLLLVLPLLRLRRRCQVVANDYDPFHHPGRELPAMGTRVAIFDTLALVGLPVLLVAMAVYALHRIDALPMAGLITGGVAIAAAVVAERAWARLRDLRADVKRTSMMPPAM